MNILMLKYECAVPSWDNSTPTRVVVLFRCEVYCYDDDSDDDDSADDDSDDNDDA